MREHHRFRLYFAWNFAKEEAWINHMALKKGLYLKKVGFCHYTFDTEGGPYRYRLEPLHRTAQDQAEKQFLRTVGAEEVCSNGDWAYYRIPAGRSFASYSCADSKYHYLKRMHRHYVAVGIAVYLALGMDMAAFFPLRMTPLHTLVLVLLVLIALLYTVELTGFHGVLRRLAAEAEQERF